MGREYKKREKMILYRLRGRTLSRSRSDSRHSTDTRDVDSWKHRFARWARLGKETSKEKQEEHDEEEEEEEGDRKEIHEEDFEEAVVELTEERRREFRSEAVVSGGVFLVVWLVGAAIYMKLEGWTYYM